MINWKVRFKNKTFWVSFIPAVLVLVKLVLELFGVNVDVSGVSNELINIIEALFLVLGIAGIVNDPTTAGVSDSQQAMKYETPRADK